ncbi:hypothetical protein [Nannocystis radixulma]|uniref:Uncharacterized protein n=1 Tax=Nannocystis radixulma TaxID=2995305 RepID=A0ABT5B2X7_9BACT|nr:hypothetical protein [Nannocystis radixulma]MDC0667431.1 hypothetical protein [Nannocystis radixulma]
MIHPRAVLVLATLAACGAREVAPDGAAPAPVSVPANMPPEPGPQAQGRGDMSKETCTQAQDVLGDLEWIPADARLAALFDLGDPGVDDAAAELARATATTPGMPVVAALGLGFVGTQLQILRRHLADAALTPRELLLLHGPGGDVVWVLRVRCDLGVLQAALARAWGVTSRATAAGPIAEPDPARGFPHDLVFLADDRLALVPAGAGGKLRRWLEGQVRPPELGAGRRAETPGEALARLEPAPIRVVLGGRGLLAGDAPAAPRTLRAWPDRVVLDAAPAG